MSWLSAFYTVFVQFYPALKVRNYYRGPRFSFMTYSVFTVEDPRLWSFPVAPSECTVHIVQVQKAAPVMLPFLSEVMNQKKRGDLTPIGGLRWCQSDPNPYWKSQVTPDVLLVLVNIKILRHDVCKTVQLCLVWYACLLGVHIRSVGATVWVCLAEKKSSFS